MKKYSGHKLYKFPTGHTLRSECEYPYKPTMKGGHTHNHAYNASYTKVFGRHSRRRIPRESKTEWRKIWEYNYKQHPNLFPISYTKKRKAYK